MEYTIKAHPTKYHGIEFRSRLEATWAAFFDISGVRWEYEPPEFEIRNEETGEVRLWSPDFLVYGDCGHSDCGDTKLYIEVKPYTDIKQFDGHVVSELFWRMCSEDATATMCGINPNVTALQHFSWSGSGGIYDLDYMIPQTYHHRTASDELPRVKTIDECWAEAKNLTQYHNPSWN